MHKNRMYPIYLGPPKTPSYSLNWPTFTKCWIRELDWKVIEFYWSSWHYLRPNSEANLVNLLVHYSHFSSLATNSLKRSMIRHCGVDKSYEIEARIVGAKNQTNVPHYCSQEEVTQEINISVKQFFDLDRRF